MLNAWVNSQYEQKLEGLAQQYDGTLSEELKQTFIKKADFEFTTILASEESIKDALLSRESIKLNDEKIKKNDLQKIKLVELLEEKGVTFDQDRLPRDEAMHMLDRLVCDAAIWDAIHQCGLPYYFAKVNKCNENINLEELNKFNQELQQQIRKTLIQKYINLDNPLAKFIQDDSLDLNQSPKDDSLDLYQSPKDDSLDLYQSLNYVLMVASTLTMVCGAFLSLPCLIIGFLSLAASMFIQQYLTDEFDNRHSNAMYKV